MSGPIAVVTPRFDARVVGGSEALSREIAVGLAGRGWDVEVLTTTAVDHYSWTSELPEGASTEDGMTVRRFMTIHHHSPPGRAAQVAIQAGRIPAIDDQVSWLSHRFSVPGLFEHLVVSGDRYRAVIFSPYLFWTTTVCLPLVANRAVSMPCLHDEVYARLDVVRPALSGGARVWFLSEPEHQLAHRLGPVPDAHVVTGAGMTVPDRYDATGFARRHGLRRPYLLYAGRREPEKGWDWLLETFLATDDVGVDLVSAGVGEVVVPESAAGRVHDLGALSDADRDSAMAGALAYAQPSRMESFSRSVMEAWLARTPVLAIDRSPVVDWHVERSGGGRTFSGPAELAAHLRGLLDDPVAAAAMAEAGRRYVLDHYTWPVVLDRMEADLAEMVGP